MTTTIGCDQCDVLSINGVACHETGCPNGWCNPVTGKGYAIECCKCGCDFVPDDKRQGTCDDCVYEHMEDYEYDSRY